MPQGQRKYEGTVILCMCRWKPVFFNILLWWAQPSMQPKGMPSVALRPSMQPKGMPSVALPMPV
eukprot:4029892-Amphidinium_carterae.1